jgi:predicted Zn-dependent protease
VAAGIDALGDHRRIRRAALATCAVVGVLYGFRSVARLPSWSSTDAVFHTLLRDRPDSYRAQWQHGRMAAQTGDIANALEHYEASLAIWPYTRPVYIEAGVIATESGHQLAARSFAERALEHFPEDPVFLRRLAVAAIGLNDTAAARSAVKRGLRVAPTDPLLNMMQAAFGSAPPP